MFYSCKVFTYRQETVQLLIENMLKEINDEKSDSAIVSGIQVLLAMIDLRRTSEQLEDASLIIDPKEFAEGTDFISRK